MLGLKNAGLISQNPATLVQLGNLRDPNALVAILGLLITASLQVRGVRGAMILGVLATTGVGAALGLVQWQPQTYGLGDLSATMGQLDLAGATKLGLLEVVFVFLFVDIFDNTGTLVGVAKRAGLLDSSRRIPRIRRILAANSLATLAGAAAGTSTVVSYIESASGVVAKASPKEATSTPMSLSLVDRSAPVNAPAPPSRASTTTSAIA